jgi:hypothetical protein
VLDGRHHRKVGCAVGVGKIRLGHETDQSNVLAKAERVDAILQFRAHRALSRNQEEGVRVVADDRLHGRD